MDCNCLLDASLRLHEVAIRSPVTSNTRSTRLGFKLPIPRIADWSGVTLPYVTEEYC